MTMNNNKRHLQNSGIFEPLLHVHFWQTTLPPPCECPFHMITVEHSGPVIRYEYVLVHTPSHHIIIMWLVQWTLPFP